MTTVNRPTCATCAYHLAAEHVGDGSEGDSGEPAHSEKRGECHRNPPVVDLGRLGLVNTDHDRQQRAFGMFPAVWAKQWCGEHSDFDGFLAVVP